MLDKEFYYKWEVILGSDPLAYWPLITDTNRFNRDTGLPALSNLGKNDPTLMNARRRLRFYRLGIPVTWVEEPFEWVRPFRFGVLRKYSTGPVKHMRVLASLTPLETQGTKFTYEVWATPRNLLGLLAIPIQIGVLSASSFKRVFEGYDRQSLTKSPETGLGRRARLVPGGGTRLVRIKKELQDIGVADALSTRLIETIARADDFTVAHLRPYHLADQWGLGRKAVLEMFLYATRVGLLDLSWHLLCPSCRVAKETSTSLKGLKSQVHCDTCLIDFSVNFEQSVELTFRPNPTIREIPENLEFCIAGPQVTPHVVVQQLIPAGNSRTLHPYLEEGRYRIRKLGESNAFHFRTSPDGKSELGYSEASGNLSSDESISPNPTIQILNDDRDEHLFLIEHVAWSDKAVTAAEVTALQAFRDLFANEALRPGDQFSVGKLAVVFTDLKQSTRMYRDIGDASAFGHVMDHFDVLKAAIAENNGALVKTIGDAVMAVFRRPVDALAAIESAQKTLAQPRAILRSLELKVGLHFGPCIAVNLNDRLDYFGTTVNLASRLVELSSGRDLILSNEIRNDPEVSAWLETKKNPGDVQLLQIPGLKGFEDENMSVWRVKTSD